VDARQSDLLDLHDNVARRVRNLETGVHPLRSEADYADSIPPTLFDGGSANLHHSPIATQADWPRYQKRSGIGSLTGQIQITDPHAGSMSGGELWGTLPAAIRPTATHTYIVAATSSPGFTTVTVAADGDVRINPGALPAGTTYIWLDGIAFPVI
jgi:hypothetical protein